MLRERERAKRKKVYKLGSSSEVCGGYEKTKKKNEHKNKQCNRQVERKWRKRTRKQKTKTRIRRRGVLRRDTQQYGPNPETPGDITDVELIAAA